MSISDELDFFTDQSIVQDPFPYFDSLRAQCPVRREPHHGAVMVTGHEEALQVYRDPETFSSCVAPTGPIPGLPFEPEGDDITQQVEQHRDKFVMYEHLVTFDPPKHPAHRALLNRLFTPRRLKENEDFMRRLAERQIDEFLAPGKCDFMSEYAKPFTLLVIADLLGVPEADHQAFRETLGAQRPGSLKSEERYTGNPLEFLEGTFTSYIEDRRREPREDVLTALATVRFPDGSTPEVIDLVRLATFLFAAGQHTTAILLSSALRIIAENPSLQQLLRDEPDRIPLFIEETLRMEGPVKSSYRLARTSTMLGGVRVPAGTVVGLVNSAVNRDPAHFEEPHEFRVDRANAREHLAFGRGIHTCIGAPLARSEARISIELLLDRMADIKISETEHGPADARRYQYDPTFILRGLQSLHLEYTPTV